ncbi:hypothetical protein AB6A40_006831 [Gnathostoma spinigerum]|uniref:Uncharacterized protein n=1 Tax=Gnathostoma spinigerum TaxID=75299 RepID=A0ABD6EU87_9BILA
MTKVQFERCWNGLAKCDVFELKIMSVIFWVLNYRQINQKLVASRPQCLSDLHFSCTVIKLAMKQSKFIHLMISLMWELVDVTVENG